MISVKTRVELLGSELNNKLYNSDNQSNKYKDFGLCATCSNFVCIKTQKNITAFCQAFESLIHGNMRLQLRSDDPVEDCTHYSLRGALSIWDMKDLAWYVNPNKHEVGFVPASEINDDEDEF